MDETLSTPGSNRDSHTALTLAQGGDAEAQFGLGLSFASSGNEADYPQAAEWYLKAAEQGHGMAQFNLGIMYSKGQGMPRHKATSLVWMSKAAQQGDPGAQYELGMRQHRLSLDLGSEAAGELRIEAYKWLQLALAQGYADAQAGSESVAMDMTHSSVIEGKRRAETFMTSPTA